MMISIFSSKFCILEVLEMVLGLEISRPRTKPNPRPRPRTWPSLPRPRPRTSYLVKAKANDFHTVLKDTSRPRTNIPGDVVVPQR